ncbi:uncharacterized protein LOC114357782 [Ostrinia furnacalis]|uniref:uncharacterized protein LOC114357782 n=1 Tax=Ostrinia furnacalis TaxID=93504 RepID=UPI00103F263B|nr:uncharacterized protein LOC114357782 [Ostrinia furnacalis]
MRWSEAVTLEFVKIYLKHECLWNPAHPGYKMKAQREKSYFSIITEFKDSTSKTLTVPEVKMKIKNLRTTYVQQVHKILQKSNPDSMYEPSLVWFHEMDKCLKHVPNHRHPTAYNTVPEAPEVDSSTQIWVDHEMQNGNMEETNPDPLVPQMEEEYTAKSPPPLRVKKEKHSPIYKKNKKKKFKHKAAIQDYSTDSNSEIVGKEDEFDIYGKYIASQLRKMDLYKALRLQLEIQNLVSEARISDITSD